MALTCADDLWCTLSVLGSPSAPMALTTWMQLSRVSIWDSGTFVCVYYDDETRKTIRAKTDKYSLICPVNTSRL